VTPTLVFDIETIPDVAGLRRLYGLGDDIDDAGVVDMASHRRRQTHGSDFLQLHLHRIVAISCALREGDNFKVWSLGEADDGEAELIGRFFDGIAKYTPQLVSWNGCGFDLPVLHYRSLVHGVSAPRYWEQGDDDREFRWNNYLGRYHTRHIDLMDMLALYQPRSNVPLDDMTRLIGFPGKLGLHGSKVWSAFQRGEIAAIRNYCETDVANTHLVFQRFQLMRGVHTEQQYRDECDLVRTTLAASSAPHWREFIEAWR